MKSKTSKLMLTHVLSVCNCKNDSKVEDGKQEQL